MIAKKGMKKGKGSRRPLNKQEMMMMQGDGVWDVIKDVAGKANEFLKKTKILSTVASMVPAQTPYIGKVAQVGAPVLKSLGYGQSGGMAIKSSPIPVMNSMDGPIVGLTSGQAGRGKKKYMKKGMGAIKA